MLPEEIAIAMKKGIALAIIGNKKLAMNVFLQKGIKPSIKLVEFLDKNFLYNKGLNQVSQLFLEACKEIMGRQFEKDMQHTLTFDVCQKGNIGLGKEILNYYKLTGNEQEFQKESSRAIIIARYAEQQDIIKEIFSMGAKKEFVERLLNRNKEFAIEPLEDMPLINPL